VSGLTKPHMHRQM